METYKLSSTSPEIGSFPRLDIIMPLTSTCRIGNNIFSRISTNPSKRTLGKYIRLPPDVCTANFEVGVRMTRHLIYTQQMRIFTTLRIGRKCHT